MYIYIYSNNFNHQEIFREINRSSRKNSYFQTFWHKPSSVITLYVSGMLQLMTACACAETF